MPPGNQKQLKPSTKICIIDQKTFEQQSSSSNNNNNNDGHSSVPNKIRNSKYKQKHQSGNLQNLFEFLSIQPKKNLLLQKKLKKKRRPVLAVCINAPLCKRRGKRREDDKKRHRTRLKKEILRCREEKRRLAQEGELMQTTVVLDALHLESTVTDKSAAQAKKLVHSRRFRDYCDNCTTPQLATLTDQLLRELNRFQRRAYAINEIKARAHRRFVIGFHEVRNYLLINKIQLVIIAPDCEECATDVGLDEVIATIKQQCVVQGVPYLFSLRRRELAYSLYKKASISCIGVLDIDGVREIHAQLLEALQEARLEYTAMKIETIL